MPFRAETFNGQGRAEKVGGLLPLLRTDEFSFIFSINTIRALIFNLISNWNKITIRKMASMIIVRVIVYCNIFSK